MKANDDIVTPLRHHTDSETIPIYLPDNSSFSIEEDERHLYHIIISKHRVDCNVFKQILSSRKLTIKLCKFCKQNQNKHAIAENVSKYRREIIMHALELHGEITLNHYVPLTIGCIRETELSRDQCYQLLSMLHSNNVRELLLININKSALTHSICYILLVHIFLQNKSHPIIEELERRKGPFQMLFKSFHQYLKIDATEATEYLHSLSNYPEFCKESFEYISNVVKKMKLSIFTSESSHLNSFVSYSKLINSLKADDEILNDFPTFLQTVPLFLKIPLCYYQYDLKTGVLINNVYISEISSKASIEPISIVNICGHLFLAKISPSDQGQIKYMCNDAIIQDKFAFLRCLLNENEALQSIKYESDALINCPECHKSIKARLHFYANGSVDAMIKGNINNAPIIFHHLVKETNILELLFGKSK
jgi:hypothetical protein